MLVYSFIPTSLPGIIIIIYFLKIDYLNFLQTHLEAPVTICKVRCSGGSASNRIEIVTLLRLDVGFQTGLTPDAP